MSSPKCLVAVCWGQSLSHLCSALQVQAQVIQETVVPKEPPPEFEFIADPPSISAFDLDVVKLTAQFVARNGRQFLTQLMQKEQRNYQFDFLRPQHSLFNYFTKLVEQYTKVLLAVYLSVWFLQQQYWFLKTAKALQNSQTRNMCRSRSPSFKSHSLSRVGISCIVGSVQRWTQGAVI